MIHNAQIEINIHNLKHNYHYFKSKLDEKTKLLIIVKANSYGHGAVLFAKAMEKEGADYLAVATATEGIVLRNAGIKLPIMVLTTGIESFSEIIENDLEPCIPDIEFFERFVYESGKKGIKNYPVHIAFDTGMHRLGFQEKEVPALKEFLQAHPYINVKSLYSHLAAADEPAEDDFTLGQIHIFESITEDVMSILPYKPMRHILNTTGIERFVEYQFDMVRLGIGVYGLSLTDSTPLKPCAFYRCPIHQIKVLGPDDGTIGYGRHGKLGPGVKTIATLPVGYADGIDRHLGCGRASFQVNGKMAPTIGNICMDMCMIDITGIDAKPGDAVTIFGEKPTAEDLAKILDTIPYEIFTSVPARVGRFVKE